MEEILSAIGKVFKWLAGMTDVCNKNMGNPYRKCKKVLSTSDEVTKSKVSVVREYKNIH